jgi:pimeloyl-ACP methyl ester carboxylesterase
MAASTVGSAAAAYGRFTMMITAQSVVQFNTMPGANQPVARQYFVRLPDNYDNTKPYRVIYQGTGCGKRQDDDPTAPKAQPPLATDPNSVGARTGAILVQLEQGTYNPATYNQGAPCNPMNMSGCTTNSAYCFDDWAFDNPLAVMTSSIPDGPPSGAVAMEKGYFAALHTAIENAYCVDKNREFYAGYSSGGWLAQQLGCWFPDVLRAQANVTGGVPPLIKAMPNYCVQHPIAYFSIHNNPDPSNTFQGSVDGARRAFGLNGCTGTFPIPPSAGAAAIPAGLEVYQITDSTGKVLVPNNSAFRCYHYTTCPAAYPMYFCVSGIADPNMQHDAQGATSAPAFWEFFSRF